MAIDRAIYTWRTPEGGEFPASNWPSVAFHKWAWKLSTTLARRHFSEAVLYTDAQGEKDLADCPWTDVVVLAPEAWPQHPALWGVAKLVAQSLQPVPYLHLDGDFFLWKMRDAWRGALCLVQSQEAPAPWYDYLANTARTTGIVPATPHDNRSYCAGAIGGTDLRRLHAYAQRGLHAAPRLLEHCARLRKDQGPRPVLWNYFLEQRLLHHDFRPSQITTMAGRQCFFCEEFSHMVRSARKGSRLVDLLLKVDEDPELPQPPLNPQEKSPSIPGVPRLLRGTEYQSSRPDPARTVVTSHGPPCPRGTARARLARQQTMMHNPRWDVVSFDDTAALSFLKEHYPEPVQRAFQLISPSLGPARADLFRYAYLYTHGGVWLDAKSYAAKALDPLLFESDLALSFWDKTLEDLAGFPWEPELRTGRGEVLNWGMAAKPGHPFFREVVEEATHRVLAYTPDHPRKGKKAVLWATGPCMMTEVYRRVFKDFSAVSVNQFDGCLRYSIEPGFQHQEDPGHYTKNQSPLTQSLP